MLATEVGLLFDQEPLLPRLFAFLSVGLVGLDLVFRRDHLGAGIDRLKARAVVRVNQTELELRYAR